MIMTYKIQNKLSPEQEMFISQRYESSFLTKVYLDNKFLKKSIDLNYFCIYDEQNCLMDILVFFVRNNTAVVVNWLTEINNDVALFFLNEIFTANTYIKRVEWQKTGNVICSSHSYSFVDNYDMCIFLPHTRDEYNMMLSKNSRKLYQKKSNRVERDMGEMVIDEVATADNICLVDLLAKWKEEQLAQQGEKSKVVVDFVKNILLELGSISYIKNKDDEVVCVCVFYKVGKHIYYEQTAYDEKYSYYSLGRVCVYQSILHFIDQGYTHFHFLWKGADYKKHYSASDVPLYNSMTYRSRGVAYYSDYLKCMTHQGIRHLLHTKWGSSMRRWMRRLLH